MIERPGERRENARTAAAWHTVAELLGESPQVAKDVVDIGGGTGGFAVRAAAAGHRVTVVDPSPDALAALGRRARELGVEVDGHQGDLAGLAAIVGDAAADLVLCHGVLEMAPDPDLALREIAEVLRPGGRLSLLVGQRSAAVLARAISGHFAQAEELLDETGAIGRSGRRFAAGEATAALERAGFAVEAVYGVRVFADLVPGSLLDLEPGATAALVALEQAVSRRPEYLPMASQLHLVARR